MKKAGSTSRTGYIDGTTDFIFGPATCWFENCEIFSKQNSYITAASSAQENPFGYVFHNCLLSAADNVTKVYLGRPWRAYAAVTFINCDLGRQIRPEGWENWRNPENEKTARYSEYKNYGEAPLPKRGYHGVANCQKKKPNNTRAKTSSVGIGGKTIEKQQLI